MDESKLMLSNQASEVFLFEADSREDLSKKVEQVRELSRKISYAEMTDLAAMLNTAITSHKKYRAGVVAHVPYELEDKLQKLLSGLNAINPGGYGGRRPPYIN